MHDTYNDTEYDTLSSKFLDRYTIHERYKNHRNWLCIQSSIHCSAPTTAAILYRVCIEVYRTRICSMDTLVDTRSIRLRYTIDTLRYAPLRSDEHAVVNYHAFPPASTEADVLDHVVATWVWFGPACGCLGGACALCVSRV